MSWPDPGRDDAGTRCDRGSASSCTFGSVVAGTMSRAHRDPPMSPLGISLLMLAAFAGFGYLAARKLAIVARLAPEDRAGTIPAGALDGGPDQRLPAVADDPARLEARGHARGDLPGLHGAARAQAPADRHRLRRAVRLSRARRRRSSPRSRTWSSSRCSPRVGYAFWRRYVQKPARLEPNREALLILSLITAIMITDFLFDGFRFALFAGSDAGIAHERAYAFAGSRVVATRCPACRRRRCAPATTLSYWIAARRRVRVPGDPAARRALPHRDRAARAVLPPRRVPPTRCRPSISRSAWATTRTPTTMRVGVRTARDLTWKDGLDAFTCTECGRCKDACPTFLTGKPLSQKWVHDSLKHHLLEQRERIVAARRPTPTRCRRSSAT